MVESTPMAAGRQRLSGAELLHRAQRLRPGLLDRQAEAERLRRLPEVTMQEFHAAGILRAIQPVAFGGFETDFIDLIDIAFDIARAYGASGWVYAVLGAHAAMLANFSERAQEEVWGRNPTTLAASSLTAMGRCRRVDGGYIVNGDWRYASGCEYCTYLIAGGESEEGDDQGRRPRRRFLLPIAEMDIIDDWYVMGLAGTGSKSLRAQELFIPDWRSLSDREFLTNTGPGRKLHDHCHLYRLSRAAHPGPLSLAIAGVGMAQHAVDYFTEHGDDMGVGRTNATERQVMSLRSSGPAKNASNRCHRR